MNIFTTLLNYCTVLAVDLVTWAGMNLPESHWGYNGFTNHRVVSASNTLDRDLVEIHSYK